MSGWNDPQANPLQDLQDMADAYRKMTRTDGPISVHTQGIDAATDGRGIPLHEAKWIINLIYWLASV